MIRWSQAQNIGTKLGVMFPGAIVNTNATAGTGLANTKFGMERHDHPQQHPGWPEQHDPPRRECQNRRLCGVRVRASSPTPRRTGPARTRPSPHSWRQTTSASRQRWPGHDRRLLQRQPRPDRTRPVARSTEGTGISPTPSMGTGEAIGYGLAALKGGYPFIDSGHPGGFNVVMLRRVGPLPQEPDQWHRLRQARHLGRQQAASG